MTFELMWRFEALKTAAIEQLQYRETLDLDVLFERAKSIYDKGYELGMHKWHDEWLEAENETPTTENTAVTEKVTSDEPAREGYKKCPKCGEEVLEAWTEHKYRKDMTPCGYKWD